MWPDNVYVLGSFLVRTHLLVGQEGAVLIDTGLFGIPGQLRQRMTGLGLRSHDLRAILLTHGHLDHTGGLAEIKRWSGAPIFAHLEEQAHIDGTYPYSGHSRWCGRMEAAGRFVFRYRSVRIDEPLVDGQTLPFFGGLEVVHLPGHTKGHCGFFSRREGVLFSGDLFASYSFSTHLPPEILNSCLEKLAASLDRVRWLNPMGIIPNHYDRQEAKLHRKRFERSFG